MNDQDDTRASRRPATKVTEVAQVIDRWVEDDVITPSQARRLRAVLWLTACGAVLGFLLLLADDTFGWVDERALALAASGTLLCAAGILGCPPASCTARRDVRVGAAAGRCGGPAGAPAPGTRRRGVEDRTDAARSAGGRRRARGDGGNCAGSRSLIRWRQDRSASEGEIGGAAGPNGTGRRRHPGMA
jgi:hypothetical protein